MGIRFLYYCFRWLLICFFINLNGTSFSQISVTTTEVLARHGSDNNQLPYSENLNFLNNKAGGIPIVESFEFRTETDELLFNQQEYLIRFDLNSSDERKAYDRVLATNKQLYGLLQAEYVSDLIARDYGTLIDYYFDLSELDLVKENLHMVHDKRIILARLLSNAEEVNVSDWLSNQDDIISLVTDSIELEQSISIIKSMFFGDENKSVSFDDFISLEKLREVVDTYLIDNSPTISSELAAIEEIKAKAEYALEEAETNKWLQYLQVRYQADNDVAFQKELSFSSSINIPTKSTNKVKRNEAALEVWDKKYDRIIEEEKDLRAFKSNVLKLKSLVVQYSTLKKMMDDQLLEKTYYDYQDLGSVSPLVLLSVQKNINRYKSKQLEALKNIYEAYLELVTNSALMIREPRINFLSNNLGMMK
ncbi:MAG: hypothetical protein ACJA1A_000030 [Saprospiraceae bacterium]|jgi:hypothetical protein